MENTVENNSLVIREEEKILHEFKSYFNLINAKPDSILKTFDENIIVEINDIKNINEMILRKIRNHYDDDGFICTVVVNYNDRTSYEFNCWEEFATHEWLEAASLKSVIIQWKFNIKLPQYKKLPQEHNIVLKICSSMRPEEVINLLFSGSIENIEEVDQLMCPVIARVDYVDALLANEILTIIGDWVKTLYHPIKIQNKFINILRSNRKFFAKCIELISTCIYILLCLFYFSDRINSMQLNYISEMPVSSFTNMIILIVLLILSCIGVKKIAFLVSKKFYQAMSEYGDVFTFKITKGDERMQEKKKKTESTVLKNIVVNILSTFIFNIICIFLSIMLNYKQ